VVCFGNSLVNSITSKPVSRSRIAADKTDHSATHDRSFSFHAACFVWRILRKVNPTKSFTDLIFERRSRCRKELAATCKEIDPIIEVGFWSSSILLIRKLIALSNGWPPVKTIIRHVKHKVVKINFHDGRINPEGEFIHGAVCNDEIRIPVGKDEVDERNFSYWLQWKFYRAASSACCWM
jgi:hypothetical protein